jgi:hypothetical protein
MKAAMSYKSNTYKYARMLSPSFVSRALVSELSLYRSTVLEMEKIELKPYKEVEPIREICFEFNQHVYDFSGTTNKFNNIFGKIHERLITGNYELENIEKFKQIFFGMSKNIDYQKAFKKSKNIEKYHDIVLKSREELFRHCEITGPIFDLLIPNYKCFPDMIGYSSSNNYSLVEIKVIRNLNFDSLKTQLLFYDFCYGGKFDTIILFDAYNGVFYKMHYPYEKEKILKQYGKMIGKNFLQPKTSIIF